LPFPEEQRLLYSLLIESNLSEAARKAIEMQPGLTKFFTEEQRRNYERGKAEGKAEGTAEGKALGKAEGKAEALLKILMRRGFTLTAEQRRHIVECIDLAMLEHWLDRALTVGSAEELFR
jgi:flagellar biosynthesis/type III secretory pathway protein FliH